MASSVSMEKCKVCGSEESLYWDLNVNTQEEYQFCDKCGYHYHYQYERDENGKVLQEIKCNIKRPKVDELEKLGGGVITMKYKNSELQVQTSVKYGCTKQEVIDRIEELCEQNIDMDFVGATWFDIHNKRIETIK